MTEEQRIEVKAKIELNIKTLKIQISELEELTKPISPDNAIGRISRMDAINNKSVAEAALRQAKRKLKNLEFALSRVYDEDFGKCARCNSTYGS